MLKPYRVLDLTNGRGELAGFMLAQLGAEVISIEPVGGSSSRKIAPFRGGESSGDSLYFSAFGRGQASVELDLAGSENDRAQLKELAKGADVIIESSDVGEMAAMGLGYDEPRGRQSCAGLRVDKPIRSNWPQSNVACNRSDDLGRSRTVSNYWRQRPCAAAYAERSVLRPRGGRGCRLCHRCSL